MKNQRRNKIIRIGLGSYLLFLAVRSSIIYQDFLTGISLLVLSISVLNYIGYDAE